MTYPAHYPAESITHIIVPRWVVTSRGHLSGPGYLWCNDRIMQLSFEFHEEIADSKNFPVGDLLKSAMVLSNYMALI